MTSYSQFPERVFTYSLMLPKCDIGHTPNPNVVNLANSHTFMLKCKSHRVCRESTNVIQSFISRQDQCDDPLQDLDHDISVGTQSEQKQMLL